MINLHENYNWLQTHRQTPFTELFAESANGQIDLSTDGQINGQMARHQKVHYLPSSLSYPGEISLFRPKTAECVKFFTLTPHVGLKMHNYLYLNCSGISTLWLTIKRVMSMFTSCLYLQVWNCSLEPKWCPDLYSVDLMKKQMLEYWRQKLRNM